jgi:hypothetical protein
MPLGQCFYPTNAGSIGCNLRSKISPSLLLGANLRQNKRKYIVNHLAVCNELDGRYDHTLLEYLLKGADTSWRSAAYIDVMSNVGDITEKFIAMIDGRNESHVI